MKKFEFTRRGHRGYVYARNREEANSILKDEYGYGATIDRKYYKAHLRMIARKRKLKKVS